MIVVPFSRNGPKTAGHPHDQVPELASWGDAWGASITSELPVRGSLPGNELSLAMAPLPDISRRLDF